MVGSSCLGSRTQRGAFEAPARPGVSSPLLRSRLGGQLGGPAWDAVSMRERFPSLGRILEVGPMGPRVTPLGSPGEPGTVFRSRGPHLTSPQSPGPVITVSEFTVPPSEWDVHGQLRGGWVAGSKCELHAM